jgi:hypothetical protein
VRGDFTYERLGEIVAELMGMVRGEGKKVYLEALNKHPRAVARALLQLARSASSDESRDGETIPYEVVFLSDRELTQTEYERGADLEKEARTWLSTQSGSSS